MQYKYFFLVLCFVTSSLTTAQTNPKNVGVPGDLIVYQSPTDGENYVPKRTTLMIRPAVSVVRGRSPQDFSFQVLGELSGFHQGSVRISDDNETVIFKPDQPFALSEKVTVSLHIFGMDNIPLISYSFRITSMSDSEQFYWLSVLREKEKKEADEFQNLEDAKRTRSETQSIPLDTVPSNFPKIVIDSFDAAHAAPGNIFLAPGGSPFITIVDNSGVPLFEREFIPAGVNDFKMESGNRLSYCKLESTFTNGVFGGEIYLLNNHYVVIDSFQCGNGLISDGHDFRLLPNGHALMEAYSAHDTDMRKVTGDPKAAQSVHVFDCIIQELDTSKNVVFEWKTQDHFQLSDMTDFNLADPKITVLDYAHLNSIEADTDGNLIVSFRHMDEVTKINRTNGKIIWRWGGKNNMFRFLGDTVQFSKQHDARRIANGHITLWDNGDNHKTVWGNGSYHDTSYSRAMEYDLNDNGDLTARAVWEYSDVPFSVASGNVQRLKNGNTFIGLGVQVNPNAIEVTPEGKRVFELSLPQSQYNYRTFRFEWPPSELVAPLPSSPNSFELRSIYPDPARSETTVTFSTAYAGDAQISFSDILGHTVRASHQKISEAGVYSFHLDLTGLRSGIYYCRLSQNGNMSSKAMIVQK